MMVSDIFKIPGTKVNAHFIVWMVTMFVSVLPGTMLWAVTLGGFRYWHLMSKWCDYLVDQHIKKNGIDWA